jgi:enoyl-[acyl-carrier protein] reductase I
MAHLAEPLMPRGGALCTMTYYGSQMVVEHYNIMGVAKAALESAVRYIASKSAPREFGFMPFRQARLRPAPLRASRYSMSFCIRPSRKRRPCLVSVMDVGIATAFLAHEASRLITGDTLYVDGGYHVID